MAFWRGLARRSRCDVAFHLLHPFHASFLHPIAERLAASWVATSDAGVVAGLRPRILVLADHHYEMFPWLERSDTLVVQVPHGLVSKNTIYERWHARADYICLPSEPFREEFTKRDAVPRRAFWLTGWPLLDDMFRWRASATPGRGMGRTILYAPTYNPELNSVEAMGDDLRRIVTALGDGVRLVIKPHPVVGERNPDWMAAWERWSREDGRVVLVRDTHGSIVPYLIAADVLLSDVSSVAFCFLALNRPIILWRKADSEPPGWYYDRDGIEWTWVEFADVVASAAELDGALRRALTSPQERASLRARHADLLFGPYQDGQAAQRIAAHIMGVLRGGEVST